ncbi:chromate resistance protein ChrB domain-containing protein [Parasedimentitalea maritima]|uniref:Sulfurtransferase n=1 Tax=Parasedimentitalea maritima TaxID=2578117 RepID=A0A6A4RE90_9RHOB|nr:sulfurtransferase/chromate resistance protein [Zongyanglinia marina]KAE9628611.1 sulfurtransferase [Zongyanglinia marina]
MAAAYSEISPNQLMRLIGTPDCPQIVDVITDEDFALDPRLIPSARRVSHAQIHELVPELKEKRVVVICQKGKKLSHGAAALLRTHNIVAEVLAGGNFAWRSAGLPLVPVAAIPEPIVGSYWVTRHRPKIDRIACPWLIRRFVDPAAQFLFVPPAEVTAVANLFNATPFDIENTFWSHRGPLCSFDVMVEEFKLATPAMTRLATVIRAADTNIPDLAPQAAGLLAFSVGLSRQYKNDIDQLEAAMPLYDALYRWARDGYDESHDWPAVTQ